jgi:hypothetical protein
MPIQPSDVENLVKRLNELCHTDPDRRARRLLALDADLAALRRDLKVTNGWAFDAATWGSLPAEQQAQVHARLVAVSEAIEDAVLADGPATPGSIMFKDYASNGAIVGLTLLAAAATSVILYWVVRLWPDATVTTPTTSPSEQTILTMIVLMGALGGLLRLTSSFAKFVGNRQLYRSWVVYYLLMPFEGASLAPAVYLLLRVGVLSPGGGSTAQLNVFSLYAFAALTGLFAKNAIDMLADVFNIVFKKVQSKDSLPGDAARTGPPAPRT